MAFTHKTIFDLVRITRIPKPLISNDRNSSRLLEFISESVWSVL